MRRTIEKRQNTTPTGPARASTDAELRALLTEVATDLTDAGMRPELARLHRNLVTAMSSHRSPWDLIDLGRELCAWASTSLCDPEGWERVEGDDAYPVAPCLLGQRRAQIGARLIEIGLASASPVPGDRGLLWLSRPCAEVLQ